MQIVAFGFILLVLIVLQKYLFRRFVFTNLDYKCEFSTDNAVEGENIFFTETVVNNKLLPVPWLRVSIFTSKWLEFAEKRSVINEDKRYITSSFLLMPGQKITRTWKVKCLKRGYFPIKTVTLLSGDLLGPSKLSNPVNVNIVLRVFPKTLDLKDSILPINLVQGDMLVKRWIIDDPFVISGVREYHSNDSMNGIHWKATAKEGRLMVRKNDFTSNYNLAIILNIQSMEFEYDIVVYKEKMEHYIKLAATLIEKAFKAGIPVKFLSNGFVDNDPGNFVVTKMGSGKEHFAMLMEIVARLQLRQVRSFDDFLRMSASTMVNTDIVLISCYTSENIESFKSQQINKSNRVQNIIVGDVDE